MTSPVARPALACLVLSAMALAACQPMHPASGAPTVAPGREIVITDSDIVRMGVTTAWQAVKLRVPRLTYGTDASGQPTDVRITPPSSVNSGQGPLLIVDGTTVSDVSYLQEIPASDVQSIRILDSQAAEALYGLRAFGGAIVVQTKSGRS